MTIEKIKNIVTDNMNQSISFRFNGSRNQIEEFTGKIVNAYKSIFIIKLNNSNITKSYAYTDILIGDLELNI